MDFIEFNGKKYPKFQSEGFAAKFAFPFAYQVLGGKGYDIGCNRLEWCYPTAIPIDPLLCEWDAYNLPDGQVDYIFSSHCLEHLKDWVEAIEYWATKIKSDGVMFLYLPHPAQEYWLPWNNRKHIHSLDPELIEKFLIESGLWENVFVTKGYDANHSFYVICNKK